MRKVIFNKVQFQNFKNVTKSKTFEFANNGLYLITGKNGSGKSTIFNAISACLFRKVETNNETIRINDLVNENVGKNLYVSLDLSVCVDEKCTNYIIDTYYNHSEFKNKTIVNIVKDDGSKEEIEYKKVDDTIDYIEKNIISYDVFNNIINYYQQNFNTFVSKTDSQQKQFFDYILSFEFFDNLREKAKEKRKNISLDIINHENEIGLKKNNILNYEKLIHEKKNYYVSKILQIDNDIYDLTVKLNKININDHKNNLSNLDNEVANIFNKYMNKMVGINKCINDSISDTNYFSNILKEKEKELNTKLNELNNDSEKQKKNIFSNYDLVFQKFLNTKSNEKNEKDKIINNLMININNIENKKDKDISEIINNYNNNLREANSKNETYMYEIEKTYMNELTVLNKEIEKYTYEINTNYEAIKKIDNSLNLKDSVCPLCLQNISEEHKPKLIIEKNKIIENINELKKNINNIQLKINELDKKKDYKMSLLETKYKNKLSEEERIKKDSLNKIDHEYKVNISKLNEELNSIKMEINNINNEIYNYKKELEEKINEEINTIEEIYKRNVNEIKNEYEIKINETKSKLQMYSEDLKNYQIEKDNLEEELNKQLSEINNKRLEIDGYIKEYESIQNNINELKNSKNIYEKEKDDIIDNFNINISKEKDDIINIEDNIITKKRTMDILDFWITNLGHTGIKSNIISSILPFINEELNNILKNIPGEPFKVNVYLKESNESFKFSFEIQNYRSGSIGYKKQSGGEKRIIDFAFLLTLRKLYTVINNVDINIILLDEFFDALDNDNCNSILDLLKILSMDTSIYIITHLEEWKSNQIFDEHILIN